MPYRMQAVCDCSGLTGHDHLEAVNRAGPGAVNGQVFVALTHFPGTCCSRWFWVPAGSEAEVRPTRQRPWYCCSVVCAAMTRHGMVMPRPSTLSRSMAQMTTPNQRARTSQLPVARASAAIVCASAAPGSVLDSRTRTRATFSLPRRRLARC
jgi:hypothetical protein